MSLTPRSIRLVALASAVGFLAVAFAIRAVAGGALEQHSGTALYASFICAGVVFLWPRIHPLIAGATALGFCWLVELAQLTGVPAALSERSLLARLALGVEFDPMDMVWYPVGVIPLVAAHYWITARVELAAQADATAQRLRADKEVDALQRRAAAAAAYAEHPALLRLRELETMHALAGNAQARIYIGFDKHSRDGEAQIPG